jgi:CRP-like cAMP-binding protein
VKRDARAITFAAVLRSISDRSSSLRVKPIEATNVVARRENRILTVLPPSDRRQLFDAASSVAFLVKTVLFEPGRPVNAVYFPIDAVISLVTPFQDGTMVEVAAIGNEGIVGVPLVPSGGLSVRAIAQVAGRCLRLDAARFLELAERCHALQRLVESYTQVLFGQIALSAACNRLHTNDARLARWLLMNQDRVGSAFPITQDFLGQLLGVRRSTVTVSAGLLQRDGAISYTRGRVTIVDRELLEAMSCECYATITSELERVVGLLERA